jgi:hypothetical protein
MENYKIIADDSLIVNNKLDRGSGRIYEMNPVPSHRFDETLVKAVLDSAPYKFNKRVTVYLLSYRHMSVKGVAYSDNTMVIFGYLGRIGDNEQKYVILHELGHMVWNDLTKKEKDKYKRIRKIPKSADDYMRTPYRDRPTEIFADDFAYTIGGTSIKNMYEGNSKYASTYDSKFIDSII